MKWLGIDIGGAQIKVADGRGFASSHSFALWKHPENLAQELRMLIAQAPGCDHLAVTMTGELADCFESKSDGVKSILQAVQSASDSRHTRVYLVNGTLVTPQVAKSRPLEAAAANWHALARFCGRFVSKEAAMMIDVGSTTCDIVPLIKGEPNTAGVVDTERLMSGELVYCGVERTPLCAIVESVPYRGRKCPVAREVFATTRDVYTLLGSIPEDPTFRQTADGRPATKVASRGRIGRMICADDTNFNHKDALGIAQAVADAQAIVIARSIERVLQQWSVRPADVILSGQGEFLARRALEHLDNKSRIVSLANEIGVMPSRCGPAHSLAVLAREAVGA